MAILDTKEMRLFYYKKCTLLVIILLNIRIIKHYS